MNTLSAIALTALLLFTTACAVEPEGAEDPNAADEVATELLELPQELTVHAAVAPGCSGNVNCTGTKTCGAWTPYTTCGATFTSCVEGCGFITRSGCTHQATLAPQNRSRTCVMRATGATCVEIDYRTIMVSCPIGG
jgi:hypothetical protein